VVLLQKAKDAKRVYATFVHSKTNCDGYKEQGITFPSSVMQATLFKEFYDEIKIPPHMVNFLEAHGTGTQVGDPEELNAIDKIFCSNRTEPLYIGSIKSNLGHSEPASGLCSIAKVRRRFHSILLSILYTIYRPTLDSASLFFFYLVFLPRFSTSFLYLVSLPRFSTSFSTSFLYLVFYPRVQTSLT
jgi:hypothetical protein